MCVFTSCPQLAGGRHELSGHGSGAYFSLASGRCGQGCWLGSVCVWRARVSGTWLCPGEAGSPVRAGAGRPTAELNSTLSVLTEECREASPRSGEEQELKFGGTREPRDTSLER